MNQLNVIGLEVSKFKEMYEFYSNFAFKITGDMNMFEDDEKNKAELKRMKERHEKDDEAEDKPALAKEFAQLPFLEDIKRKHKKIEFLKNEIV